MHLLLRREGGTEHVLLALLAAPSTFAVVLSTKAAHSSLLFFARALVRTYSQSSFVYCSLLSLQTIVVSIKL